MAVLVTGGAGYIGSVATELLVAAGEQVVVLDNLSEGYRAAIEPGATFVEGDIHDRALVRGVLEKYGVDAVMHFAAFIQVGESYTNPAKYFDNNYVGALSVLDAMVEVGVKRFIFSSTAATYGNPVGSPITEDMPKDPINPYGLSKRMIEQTLEWYDQAYGLRYAALRYFNASGATERHGENHKPETHLIPNIFMAVDGERDALTLFGDDYPTPDGTCVRDYIHVADLCGAHVKALNYLREGGASSAFNLGTAQGYSNLEVIRTVEQVTGKKVPYAVAPRRLGDSDRLVASSDKARRVLGWQPVRDDLETIVADAWAWRKAHPKGYEA